MKKIIALFLVLLLAMGVIIACGSSAKPEKKQITIGFNMSTLTNVFFVGMKKGVLDACKERGVNVIETNADGDTAKQLSQIEDLITKKVNVLLINPLDADAIGAAEKKAMAANIPVIYIDRGSNTKEYTCFIETDNVAMGNMSGDYIVKWLTKKYGEPKGNVVEIEGLAGVTPTRDRGQGFNDIIKKYPGIKVVARQNGDFNQEKSLNVMQNIIQANSKIDAVYGHNDDCILGALKALEGAGKAKPVGDKDHICIVGIDGTFQAIDAIQKDKIDATISQAPIEMGVKGVELAIKAANGEKIEKHILNRFYIIDKSNAADPNNWGNAVK